MLQRIRLIIWTGLMMILASQVSARSQLSLVGLSHTGSVGQTTVHGHSVQLEYQLIFDSQFTVGLQASALGGKIDGHEAGPDVINYQRVVGAGSIGYSTMVWITLWIPQIVMGQGAGNLDFSIKSPFSIHQKKKFKASGPIAFAGFELPIYLFLAEHFYIGAKFGTYRPELNLETIEIGKAGPEDADITVNTKKKRVTEATTAAGFIIGASF